LFVEKELEFYPNINFSLDEIANGMIATFEIMDKKSSVKSSVKIIELIHQNNYITIPELSDTLKISTRAVEKQISNLKKQGRLKRIGPAKGGYWEIDNDE